MMTDRKQVSEGLLKYAALMLTAGLAVMSAGCASTPVSEAPAAASPAESAVTAAVPVEEESIEESSVNEEIAEESIVKEEIAEESIVKEEITEEKIVEEGIVGESNAHSGSQESEESKDSEVHSDSRESDRISEIDWERVDKDPAYDDEVLAVYYLSELANLQSLPETSSRYCVVDMRDNHEAYDVDWDYGASYENWVRVAKWDKVFDIDYYEAAFPMLAIQYHYDEEQLLRHFQTVGIHEGRQGSEDFNVGAYMDWCAENLPYTVDAFGGDYAMYYLFYASAIDDQPDSFPADGRPVQYKAVMTYSQQEEFDAVNGYRAEAGLDPYIYDPEMAAFANFRAWTNQDQKIRAHAWLFDPKYDAELNLCYDALGTDCLAENTVETSKLAQVAWHKQYAASESHYNAMVSTKYHYFGASHAYVDSVAIGDYSSRCVEFDTFTDDLSTAMNP